MSTLAMQIFLDSAFGELTDLPHVGSAMEHPLVFDAAAREFRDLAEHGRVQIVLEHFKPDDGRELLISEMSFRRLL